MLACRWRFLTRALLLALSGIFAGTFTLTFAYISDCVEPSARAPAYGLALVRYHLLQRMVLLSSACMHRSTRSYIGSRRAFRSIYMRLALVLCLAG